MFYKSDPQKDMTIVQKDYVTKVTIIGKYWSLSLKESIIRFIRITQNPFTLSLCLNVYESYLDGVSVCRQNSSKTIRQRGKKKRKVLVSLHKIMVIKPDPAK